MISHSRELTVAWGESDPFGLVYYPHMLAWVNDTEHELFRAIGVPIIGSEGAERTAFVMGELQMRFTGPAACGERVRCTLTLARLGESSLTWDCRALNLTTGGPVNEGRATRVHARLRADGSLAAEPIPAALRATLLGRG